MKYFIQIFGCQMNKSDAERIASLLDSLGYKEIKQRDKASLVIIVTCSVRQSAENRVYGMMKHLRKLKKKNRKFKIILTGCMALQKEAVKKLKDVDIFLDIKDLNTLPKLLNTKSEQEEIETYFSIKPKYESSFTAYVPIMTGCNNFCSYCIVPYVRGREVSRQSQEILNEVECLLDSGYKEIILLGQNVNSYKPGKNDLGINDFPELLEKVARLKGDFWLRFTTSHPKDFSDKLIKVIKNNKKVTEYIHLPIQSGSDTILKKMNRKYTVAHYKKLVAKIKKAIPGVSISTDIIIGFPGETKELFESSAKTFEQIRFDMAYLNRYSPRKGTEAAKYKDNVTELEKKRREEVLNTILKKTALEYNKQLIGKTVEVLVDNRKKDIWFGKTRTYKVVRFKSNKNLLGKFVKIKMTKAGSFGFEGRESN